MYLGIRKWYPAEVEGAAETEMRPGKGISLRPTEIPWLQATLDEAEQTALKRQLLDEEVYEVAGRPWPPELAGQPTPASSRLASRVEVAVEACRVSRCRIRRLRCYSDVAT